MFSGPLRSCAVALGVVTLLAGVAVGGPFWWTKVDNPVWYAQISAHMRAPAEPAGHAVFPGGQNWATPFVWAAAPAAAVRGTDQHLIAPHPWPPYNETAPGPLHRYALANPPPPPGMAFAVGRLMHGRLHPDLFIEALAANANVAMVVDFGRHDPPPGCPAFHSVLDGSQQVPPTPTPAFGVAALNYHIEAGTLGIAIAVHGVPRELLLGAAIHLGGPGQIGPPIYELGGGYEWMDADGMAVATVREQPLPPDLLGALMAGQAYINIKTVLFPEGEIRGQIAYPPQYSRGDLNCDSLLNAFDIDAFVMAVTDPAGYEGAFPTCHRELADCNADGQINAFDIDPFVELLTGG